MSRRRPPALHADLLQALAMAGRDTALADRLALRLGFCPHVLEAIPDVGQTKSGGKTVSPGPGPKPDPDLPGHTQRLRARLPVLTQIERVPHADEPAEAPDGPMLTEADCQPRSSDPPPMAPPLLPRTALWPSLRRTASHAYLAELDIAGLVRRLARGQTLTRLPRRTRRSMAGQLWVLQDASERLTPYQRDFDDILDELLRLRGEQGLTLWRFRNLPRHTFGRTGAEGTDEWGKPLPPPPVGHRLLVLSDLGTLASGPALIHAWQHQLNAWRQAGAEVAVWAPIARRQVPVAMAQLADIQVLHDRAGLRRQRGAWRTDEQRQAELRRLDGLKQRLQALASCAVDMSPDLLRELRLHLPETAAEPGLEALYWQSPQVLRSRAGRVLRADAAAAARAGFQQLDPQVQVQVLNSLLRHHASIGRSTEATEVMLWASHASVQARETDATRSQLGSAAFWWNCLSRRLARSGPVDPSLQSFARDLLHRQWHDAAWQTQCGPQVAALAASLGDGQLVPPHVPPQHLLRAQRLKTRQTPGTWHLISRRDELWAWPAGVPLPDRSAPLCLNLQGSALLWRPVGRAVHTVQLTGEARPIVRLTDDRLPLSVSMETGQIQIDRRQRPDWAEEWGYGPAGLFVVARWPWGEPVRLRQVDTEGSAERAEPVAGPGALGALASEVWRAEPPPGRGPTGSHVRLQLIVRADLSDLKAAMRIAAAIEVEARQVPVDSILAGELSEREIAKRLNEAAHSRDVASRGLVLILDQRQIGPSQLKGIDWHALRLAIEHGALRLAMLVIGGSESTEPVAPLVGLDGFRFITLPRPLIERATSELASRTIQWLCPKPSPGQLANMIVPGPRGRPAWRAESDRYGLSVLWSIGNVTQRFRHIPPGEFWMGSPDEERAQIRNKTHREWADRHEQPRHRVRLTQGLWLADTACTQALWLAVMGGRNPSEFQDNPDNPVENVSWDDVQQFLHKLQPLLPEGCVAVLPTEAEWEYACRAGTETAYSFGPRITTAEVNFSGKDEYDDVEPTLGKPRGQTVPVTTLPPNGWGLYEMHGNVWEWCADGDLRSYAEVKPGEVAENPIQLPEQGTESPRVIRGGCLAFGAREARSARRLSSPRGHRILNLGFRLALRSSSSSPEPGYSSPEATQGLAPGRQGPVPAARRDAGPRRAASPGGAPKPKKATKSTPPGPVRKKR